MALFHIKDSLSHLFLFRGDCSKSDCPAALSGQFRRGRLLTWDFVNGEGEEEDVRLFVMCFIWIIVLSIHFFLSLAPKS